MHHVIHNHGILPSSSQTEWEIILQLNGNAVITTSDYSYKIRKDDIIVIPSGCPYKITSDSICSQAYLKTQKLDFHDIVVVQDHDMYIHSLMNILYQIFLDKKNNYSLVVDHILEVICFHIKILSNQRSKYSFVNKMQNIIYKNIANPDFDLTIEQKKSGFSADYFRKCFKEEVGMTPLEYLINLRINQAKGLLLNDSFVSVSNVAEQCGFRDNLYFSTCFKKHVGASPLQYRKKQYQAKASESTLNS